MQTTGSLYFHIPFCKKKCPYCHFFVVKSASPIIEEFSSSLLLEWEIKKKNVQELGTICSLYFGGGTPSQLPLSHLETILQKVRSDCLLSPSVEITIEVNPEDASLPLFQHYRSLGINRVSIGVQSLQSSLLPGIGRAHSKDVALQAIFDAKEAGIDNISIDLMYDLPHQSKEDFFSTVDQLQNLPITHLSLYNMTIEPNTAFGKQREKLTPFLPKEEDAHAMLIYATKKLPQMGLNRYEISAFCKTGYASVHNTGYWKARPFIGLGPSAFSYFKGKRFQNHANLKRYHHDCKNQIDPIGFCEKLPYPQNMHELLLIALRLLQGVQLSDYPLPSTTVDKIEELKKSGFLCRENDRLFLSEKGLDFYDFVASELI